MKYIIGLLSFACVITSYCASAQALLADIDFYADITINAVDADHRVRANEQLVQLIETYLANEEADLAALKDEVPFISQQQLEGSAHTIYTWQVSVSDDAFETYGYVKEAGGKVVKLQDLDVLDGDTVYEELSPDRWLGALYYNTIPTIVDGQQAWLLFGYDGHSKFDRIKVCDVIRFVDGEPVFGAEIFKRGDGPRPDVRSRLLLSYSSDSNVTLNYNPNLNIIMHDHLINRMGRLPGQGTTWLSDGSYEGYMWDGEYWVYDEKVFEQVLQEGNYPRPTPVLEQRGEGRSSK
jgi:hypothetical protein